jgi:hypothetical protein
LHKAGQCVGIDVILAGAIDDRKFGEINWLARMRRRFWRTEELVFSVFDIKMSAAGL